MYHSRSGFFSDMQN